MHHLANDRCVPEAEVKDSILSVGSWLNSEAWVALFSVPLEKILDRGGLNS